MSDGQAKIQRQRLRRAFRTEEAGTAKEGGIHLGADVRAALRQRHQQSAGRDRQPIPLPAGEDRIGSADRFFLRRLVYPVDHRHGSVRIGDALAVDPAELAPLCRKTDPEPGAAADCLFLDTETTGLSSGAGNVVFMCGLGFFEAGNLVIEQTFLRAYSEEEHCLAHIQARLARHRQLVTFVGKSFDRHRLHARMTVHKVPAARDVLTMPHLDLFHLTRRALRVLDRGLPDNRLQTIERHCLGLTRHDDLAGSQAPCAFLDWITDRSGPIDRVFEHNRLDVLSLVALYTMLPHL